MKKSNKTITGIIPARGGSKGVPKKNSRLLGGKPLIAYTIEAAKQSNCFHDICVSTDDQEIMEIGRMHEISVIDRPRDLSGDTVPSQDVVRHALENQAKNDYPDLIVLLQPTSPLRTGRHIAEAVAQFLDSACNSCISVAEAPHHPYKSMTIINQRLFPLFDPEKLHCPRQKLTRAYQQNGAIYIVNTDLFLKMDRFAIEPILPYVMNQADSIDIDTLLDFEIAEFLLQKKQSAKGPAEIGNV